MDGEQIQKQTHGSLNGHHLHHVLHRNTASAENIAVHASAESHCPALGFTFAIAFLEF